MKMYDDPLVVISHEAHRAHKLKLVTTDGPPFRCDGCMEPGSGVGRRYRCDNCEFDLHTSCALAESTLKHPLFGDLEFKLLHSSPSSIDADLFCCVCGYITPRFVYQYSSKKEDFNLHPCCAALKMETVLKDGHILQLCKEAKKGCFVCGEKSRPPSSSASNNNNRTFWGFRKGKLWAYRWQYGGNEGYLHVTCMKSIAAQSWEQTYQDSPGGGVVEASVPVMTGMLSWLQSRNSVNSTLIANGVGMSAGMAQVLMQAASLSAPPS